MLEPSPAPPAPTPIADPCGDGDGLDPMAHGNCVLIRARSAAPGGSDLQLTTADTSLGQRALAQSAATLDPRPESFVITTLGSTTIVVGRDPVGAMYGAQELAERLDLDGAAALPLATAITGAPALSVRAANPFLVLPEPGEASWWFLDRAFWAEYIDLLARARINFLDMHGMYNLGNTIFPNALLYFATSATYPEVGASAADRERNLAMLNEVIRLATARGIHVGLMSYRADTTLTGDDPQALSDDDATKTYVREAAEDLARRAPGLWRLGFRIGESARAASWYEDTFVAGVRAAGTGVRLSTRTWGATKSDILGIVAAAGNDTIVEAKFNGEHLGAPYAVAGGLFSVAGAYSYQDFLNPPTPYHFVFQLRAGGTHRIFRYASYSRTQRTVRALVLSPAVEGFTLEPAHAYYPARDYYHAIAGDMFSTWTFRRDELSYLLFGRLGYDPATPERVFRRALATRVGTDALWDKLQAASDIVPWMQTAHTCGIDSRDAAPELELAGDVGYWASPQHTQAPNSACDQHEAMDSFAIALPADLADDAVAGRPTTRLSPLAVAALLTEDAARANAAVDDKDSQQVEARDVIRECRALADLGTYFAHKLRAASSLAVYTRTGRADYLDAARAETGASNDARRALAADTNYIRSFDDHLRMSMLGLPSFHWSLQLPRLDEDRAAIDVLALAVGSADASGTAASLPPAGAWLDGARPSGPGLAALAISPADPSAPTWTVSATLARPASAGAEVRILWKPFRSDADWTAVAATPVAAATGATSYVAQIAGGGQGGMFAVEVAADAAGWRYPDVTLETPYQVLAPPSP
ncbi:MAG TPA: hypothetical protein VGK52_07655 [Polyangia bacterium]